MKITELKNIDRFKNVLWTSFENLKENQIVERILKRDFTVWKDRDEEISNRLGWLNSLQRTRPFFPLYEQLAEDIKDSGYSRILLLGMGGSSLAPAVINQIYPLKSDFPVLSILDSTCPLTVGRVGAALQKEKIFFLVSSKSGTTAETINLFRFFYDQVEKKSGPRAPEEFIAITDPQTLLETLGKKLGLKQIINGLPDVGGRFSALSPFGLLPAALMGTDLEAFSAAAEDSQSALQAFKDQHPGVILGTILGTLYSSGFNKLTLVMPSQLMAFGRWLEQLIAESTGKEGQGIVPVLEPLPISPEAYSRDRIFVTFSLKGENEPFWLKRLETIEKSGLPCLHLSISPLELAEDFFVWEIATAIAGYFLKINPFDQPDVELTKKKTREILEQPESSSLEGYLSSENGKEIEQAIKSLLFGHHDFSGYISLLVYLPSDDNLNTALDNLARHITDKTHLPCTWNYGPAYLHSTGQLHKGDSGQGHFLGLFYEDNRQVAIPAEPDWPPTAPSFNHLFRAQALGDLATLQARKRKVVFLNLKGNLVKNIFTLNEVVRNL
ncbi:MAG TPA: hypothetical protein PLP57_04870 [Candidatus Saccharicenans sp.]|jgi:glucose-6-phosphate isomerase/transaldolase/glucose-6-phosphate isomerase|nr:hypothetical protein [Candidatus Saccharicenans sp.]HRD01960.1 hypothetical protein [Candidatus Saccharicenans sp.]